MHDVVTWWSTQKCYNCSKNVIRNKRMNEAVSWGRRRLGHGWIWRRLGLLDHSFRGSTLRLRLGYEEIPFPRMIYVLGLVFRARVEWPWAEMAGACMGCRGGSKS